MNTYNTINGTYDIYIDFNVEKDKNFEDYAYFQHTETIAEALISNGKNDWIYCSATAAAQCLSLYYNNTDIEPMDFMEDFLNTFSWGNDADETVKKALKENNIYDTFDDDYENNTEYIGTVVGNEGFKGADEYASTILGTEKFDNYVSEIVESLKIGRPVITCVFRYELDDNKNIVWKDGYPKVSTHFVTIVGVKSGIDLDNAQYTDFVMFDPGTEYSKKLTTLDDTYKGYTYYPYNYRIITPYLIDENGDFILVDGEKTTDPKYAKTTAVDNKNYNDDSGNSDDVFSRIDATGMSESEKSRIKAIIKRDIENNFKYVGENEQKIFKNLIQGVKTGVATARTTRYDPLILYPRP